VAQGIIGLGNPGPEYRDTRHNVGHRVVNGLARALHARFDRAGGHAVAEARWRGQTLYLVKTHSFMNESGPAVARLCRRLHLGPAEVVLVYDDLDLPLGTVRVRMKGSAGGHNGVRSIIQALGTSELRRVKIGIGRPVPPGGRRTEVVDHVLSPFLPEELEVVEKACADAGERALQLTAAAGTD
jgi:peptidyl-tRNA hydrolase, PTH1 family